MPGTTVSQSHETGNNPHMLDAKKAELRQYFGSNGFDRWRKIYGSERVSFIRNTVRVGHAAMVSQALAWSWENGSQLRVLDAGCGTGIVSRAIARAGGEAVGCDLTDEMAQYATHLAGLEPEPVGSRLSYFVSDLERAHLHTSGPFDVVFCLDVLIYYPEEEFGNIIQKLSLLSPNRLIFTYAPASPALKVMHRVGRLFPRGHRSTSMEIIGKEAIERGLARSGFRINRQRHFSKGFYHVVLAEATR